MSEAEAERNIGEMQAANTMAHVEKSVKDGEMTRAEADAFYKKHGYR